MKNYRNGDIRLLVLGFLCICLAACGASNSNQIHMTDTNFAQSSITINKGTSITLVNDSTVIHAIDHGRWLDTTQIPNIEAGAPDVGAAASMNPNDTVIIGPFNKAGTFHYYCTIHPGMNLDVVVK